jgi:hypothetical protein
MTISKLTLSLLLVALINGLGCPGPTPATIDDIDGLGGGTLSSKLIVPELAVTGPLVVDLVDALTLAADSVTADVINVSTLASTTTSAGALTATSAQVDTLEVTAEITALSVAAQTTTSLTTTTTRLARGGRVFLGVPVGAVDALSENVPDADDSCATAFPTGGAIPAAHLCTEQEMTTASASAITDAALSTLEGASYAVFSSAQVTTEAGLPVRVDNCQQWSALTINADPLIVTDDVAGTDYVTAKTAIRIRNINPVGVAERLVFTPSWSFDCRSSSRKFACCQ